jgi:hypothetical protein
MLPFYTWRHVATPLLEQCEDDIHTPKMGFGSPLGLPKLQSLIVGVKTPHLELFFMPLESYWSVDVENGLAWTIWTYAAQVMEKIRARRLLTTKSQESTRPRCVQMQCDTPLESSQQELQVCFKPHPNPRSEQRVMNLQSPGNPN